MNTTRTTLAAACCGAALLLAGCSSSDSAADTTAGSDASTAPQMSDSAAGAQPSGLTGEIAYVSGTTAQVQDGSSQTAVTWTDDTTFTQQVDIALADVSVGSCVVVTLGDDGSASTIAVTDAADDGTCSTGFGGGMGGGVPGDMPSGAPGDGQMPTDMPTDMPTTMPTGSSDGFTVPSGDATAMPSGGGFDTSSFVSGTVTTVGSDSLTVESTDGTSTDVSVTADSSITGTQDADASAIVVGMCLTAMGDADSSGGYAATSISVFDGGDAGCVSATSFGGRGGGMAGGPVQTDSSAQ
ncbi:hypothetical protein RN607_08665 [Demequina capsici]|uniref:DUF5666 domain-containing protein n=1 Tax=Demequina capsici TaxID=3075620 RepID=A0AA96F5Z8_9MICO|nr:MULTISPECIES: hypothetical protein [unclassified Demequina]WNM23395.1 hypothetical protein RN606_08440 [Demequina sp. OYTSA14]WNM26272.1 hypothetical protein RN607_08665 [Demequina sp. PMTSA13]